MKTPIERAIWWAREWADALEAGEFDQFFDDKFTKGGGK